MKNLLKNLGTTLMFLAVSSVLSFLFFHLGNKNPANIALFFEKNLFIFACVEFIYILTFLTALFYIALLLYIYRSPLGFHIHSSYILTHYAEYGYYQSAEKQYQADS